MGPDEVFIAYSDGVTEPENEFGEFGEERLIDLISNFKLHCSCEIARRLGEK